MEQYNQSNDAQYERPSLLTTEDANGTWTQQHIQWTQTFPQSSIYPEWEQEQPGPSNSQIDPSLRDAGHIPHDSQPYSLNQQLLSQYDAHTGPQSIHYESIEPTHQWTRSMQPVAPERFPTSTMPLVFEGYVSVANNQPHYPSINSASRASNSFISQHDAFDPAQTGYGPLFPNEDSPSDSEGLIDDEDVTELEDDVLPARRGRGRPRGSSAKRRRTGRRGGWNKGKKTGLRSPVEPGEEYDALHRQANIAYIDEKNYDKALELILKAISINPEVYSAHQLLYEIYCKKGDRERALAALFSGAHACPNDPDVWRELADKCLDASPEDRTASLGQEAYCLTRVVQIDPDDEAARFRKAEISRELGHYAKALKDLDVLIRANPHNPQILHQIAEVCLDVGDLSKAKGLYENALELQRLDVYGHKQYFTWAHLIVYVDLVAKSDGPQEGIRTLNQIARLLVGRADEMYWDTVVEDDREWDLDHAPRRLEVSEFQPTRHSNDKFGSALSLELRIKLGELRLERGQRGEAIRHFEWLEPERRDEDASLYEYHDLFMTVADALKEVKEYQQGLRYYEALLSLEMYDDVEFWMGLGICSAAHDKNDQAREAFEKAKALDENCGEARTQLAKIYTTRGNRKQAIENAREAIHIFENSIRRTNRRKYERSDNRQARVTAQNILKAAYKLPRSEADADDEPLNLFSRRRRRRARRDAEEIGNAAGDAPAHRPVERERRPKRLKRRLTKAEKHAAQRLENVHTLFSSLSINAPAMRDGDDEATAQWTEAAEALIDDFRSNKVFYPAEKHMRFQGYDRDSRLLQYQKRGIEDPILDANEHYIHSEMGSGVKEEDEGRTEQMMRDRLLPSIESNIPNDYCGIVFSNWLDIFLEYALLMSNQHEESSECYAIIQAAIDCAVWWHDPEALLQIYTCYLACAIAFQDEQTLFSVVLRWFMREYAFCSDTYRLFAALNFYYPHEPHKGGKLGQMNHAIFRNGPNQKFVFRQVMSIDSQLPENYNHDGEDGPVPDFMRKPRDQVRYTRMGIAENDEGDDNEINDDDDNADDDVLNNRVDAASLPGLSVSVGAPIESRLVTPKEMDVALLTLYAQILYAGGSFPNALSYFFRAYSLDPKNPTVLLGISLSYLHQMFKRQNENRHMYLLQGWAFFEEYARARIEWAKAREQEIAREGRHIRLVRVIEQEVEFNRARCWQMLGLHDLAIRGYERMLDKMKVKMERTDGDVDMDRAQDESVEDDCSMEAAYSMAMMYAINGDAETARGITEKYLVVE